MITIKFTQADGNTVSVSRTFEQHMSRLYILTELRENNRRHPYTPSNYIHDPEINAINDALIK